MTVRLPAPDPDTDAGAVMRILRRLGQLAYDEAEARYNALPPHRQAAIRELAGDAGELFRRHRKKGHRPPPPLPKRK